jgi:Domain of unknown function (DUF4918)
MTFADKIIQFNNQLYFDERKLPAGIKIMNPFLESEYVNSISAEFYKKYYNDNNQRHLILGINPGRFGAGLTGIPFTDPKHLQSHCNINYNGPVTHEPSSVFVYEVINAFGGLTEFYNRFYINSICPLGFTSVFKSGKETNYNYYDSKELKTAVCDFIIESIEKQIGFGINTDTCFCFGTGINAKFLQELNNERKYFKNIVPLEHPRYIMQYKSRSKQFYIDKYVTAFKQTAQCK